MCTCYSWVKRDHIGCATQTSVYRGHSHTFYTVIAYYRSIPYPHMTLCSRNCAFFPCCINSIITHPPTHAEYLKWSLFKWTNCSLSYCRSGKILQNYQLRTIYIITFRNMVSVLSCHLSASLAREFQVSQYHQKSSLLNNIRQNPPPTA